MLKRTTKKLKNKPIIGIIGGQGKMGNWFKNFFEGLRYKVLISDLNTKLSNVELTKKADIVIISVPIKETVKIIQEVRNWVRKDALLCDITSLKVEQVKAMKKEKSGALGIHPLFGHSAQTLEGQNIIFCKIKDNHWVNFLRKIFIDHGAEVTEVSPKEHDLQMAVIQALTYFINISLARTFHSQKVIPKSLFLTPVFKLQSLVIGRILGQNPKLCADIEIENPYFKKVLANFNKETKSLTKDIENKNFKNFIKKFEQVSLYLEEFTKVAQIKSTEVLRMIDRQPIRAAARRRKIDFKKKLKIGFLGPKGTFSHQAAIKILSEKNTFVSLPTIKQVFEKINDRELDLGVVPVENTIGGIVSETINSLINYPLKVNGSFDINIHHFLLSPLKNKRDIKIIKSHAQALDQCKSWLEKNLSKAKLETAPSTISPILERTDKNIGFICSEIAAKIYNLNILARNIEENKDNFTKFYLISSNIDKKLQKQLKAEKTLILLAVYNRIGILRDILNVFAKENLNLTALHSIPSRVKPWDYLFFIEIQAPFCCLKIKKALRAIQKYCPIIKPLGAS